MSKKEEEEIRTRTLTKIMGGTIGTLPAADPETTPISFDGGEGWSSAYNAGGWWVMYNIQSIDLSGYRRQEATLFPQGILFQDMDTAPVSNNMGTAVPVKRATILSMTPISESDLTDANLLSNYWHLPGSAESTHNLDNIFQGRVECYMQLDSFAGLQKVATSSWGSGDSTAGSKIWFCDAYLVPNIGSLAFTISDQAVVIPSLIATEDQLEYFMRLSRSLEPVY